MSDTYADVDRAADVEGAVAWQERVDRWPAVRAYKAAAARLLDGLAPVLDVGCGPGLDVVDLGHGAVGVDRSAAMAARAAGRGAVVAIADAGRLPFPDGAFAGTRCDRVLQHLDAPGAALAELVRVTAPGGRVVVADPDQGTLAIAVPDARPELVDRVTAARRTVGYRNGTLARRLPELLLAAGLADLTVDAVALALTDPDDAFGIGTWPAAWGFPPGEAEEWEAAVGAAAGRGFLYAVTYLVVSGRRPLR